MGIGYSNVNYAYDNETGQPVEGLVVVPIDLNNNSRVDEDENFYNTRSQLLDAVASGAYPSPPVREVYLVTKDEFTGAAKEFVRWILTDGQQYVSEMGYTRLPETRLVEELAKLD